MDLVVIAAFVLVMFLLYWKNKEKVLQKDKIIYFPIIDKGRTYSWDDVRKVHYATEGDVQDEE